MSPGLLQHNSLTFFLSPSVMLGTSIELLSCLFYSRGAQESFGATLSHLTSAVMVLVVEGTGA